MILQESEDSKVDAIAAGRPTEDAGSFGVVSQLFVVAAAYLAAGMLALSAGGASGASATVWPASGVALVSVLLLGYRVWPGVWLGAVVAGLAASTAPLDAAVMAAGGTLE